MPPALLTLVLPKARHGQRVNFEEDQSQELVAALGGLLLGQQGSH